MKNVVDVDLFDLKVDKLISVGRLGSLFAFIITNAAAHGIRLPPI